MTRSPVRPLGLVERVCWFIGAWLVGAAITVGLFTLFGVHLRAQSASPRPDPASDPAAVALHERHVRASGTATTPPFQHYIMEMRVGPGPLLRTESFHAKPDRIFVRTTMGGELAMEFGFDGTTAWSNSPTTGLIRLDSAALGALRASATFGTTPALDPSATQRSIGRSTFDDQLVDGVRVVLASGDSADIYYSVTTGLMAGMQLRSTQTPAANMTITLRDYQRIGGRMVSTTSVMRAGAMDMIARTVHIDHDPIDAATFRPPRGVPAKP